jgi:Leucine-rich repeat (LRR) protein
MSKHLTKILIKNKGNQTMEENIITIPSDNWHNKSLTDLKYLRDIEFAIVYAMYNSQKDLEKIAKKLQPKDFTFIVNRKIFEYLLSLKNDGTSKIKKETIKTTYNNIHEIYNIAPTSVVKILENKKNHSENIDIDIFELLDFSQKRQEIIAQNIDDEKAYIDVVIDDEYGCYAATYFDGIVVEIKTDYIFHLPNELCDTFEYSMKNIIPYVQMDNYETSLIINEDDHEDLQAFRLKKNIDKIEQSKRLIQWARDNNLSSVHMPRNRGRLLEYKIIEIFDGCNLKTIPSELFEIRQETFSFDFSNNKIKELPSNIGSAKCSLLMLCNNKIAKFPKSVYELKEISTLCLHGNKIKSLPNDMDNMKKLKHISISNNPIKKLPASIANITTLKELDIENTIIEEDSLEFLHLENIEKISFDDRLLPYFIKNFQKLINIDTINLTHSEYIIDNPIFSGLNLDVDDNKWMDEKDYLGTGCIILSKKSEPFEIPEI